MASGWYQTGLLQCINGTIDLDTDADLRLMLVDSDYVFNPDNEIVDNGASDTSDASEHELVATNYTGGHQGAGRKQPTISMQANDTDNRVDIALTDQTWSSLGGASNDTIGGAILMKDGTSNDTTAVKIAFFDLTDTPTNGGDITLDFTALGSGGNMRIAV